MSRPKITNDLETFFAFVADSGRMAAAHSAIADHQVPLERLIEIVPLPVMRAALMLLDPGQYEAVQKTMDDPTGQAGLEKARHIAKERFAGLDRHPAIVDMFAQKRDFKEKVRNLAENRINAIDWDPGWLGFEDGFLAAIRLRLLNESNDVVLSTTLDWDDTAFLIHALSGILKLHIQLAKQLDDAGLLLNEGFTRVPERIQEARQFIDEALALLESLNAQKPTGPGGTAQPD